MIAIVTESAGEIRNACGQREAGEGTGVAEMGEAMPLAISLALSRSAFDRISADGSSAV
jgi:hypothetical protein